MTLGGRKKVLKYTFIVSCTVVLFSGIIIIYLFLHMDYFRKAAETFNFDRIIFVKTVARSLLLVVMSLAFQVFLFLFFQKTLSAEVFFLSLFLFSLVFESITPINLLLLIKNYPDYFISIVTRVVFIFRFFGILALFSASLFPIGFEMGRIEIILGTITLLSFILGATVPINGSEIDNFLLFRNALSGEVRVSSICLVFFGILNFLWASYRHQTNFFFLPAAGLAFIYLGYSLVFLPDFGIRNLLGYAVTVLGLLTYTWKIHSIYLWR